MICVHDLHYSTLLNDFWESVIFVCDTKNLALEPLSREQQEETSRIMKQECSNLLIEIDQLEHDNKIQDQHLKNTMNLISYIISTNLDWA